MKSDSYFGVKVHFSILSERMIRIEKESGVPVSIETGLLFGIFSYIIVIESGEGAQTNEQHEGYPRIN